uniref:CPG4 domain-containing protein n=1 Tax=Steinernema glaseri TaxID=37863 RepID=A0A1I8AEQ7_9BILA
MKTVAVAFVVLLGLSLTYGHPVFQAQMDSIINSSPCLKKCVDAVGASNEELTVTRTVDYGHYFGNFDKICGIIDEARECIDKCGIESNPFKLHSTTFICEPEMRADGHPVFQAQMDSIINSSPCLKKCVDAVGASNEELTVTRTVDYGHYFGNFDKICGIIEEARECIDNCQRIRPLPGEGATRRDRRVHPAVRRHGLTR